MKKRLWTILLLTLFAACDNDKDKENGTGLLLWKTYTLENSALINNYVNCVTVDRNDHIWVGNYYGDVTEFDGAEWTHHVTKDSGIFRNTIRKIVEDHNHVIWVGSEYGLFRHENDSWMDFALPPLEPWYRFYGIFDLAVGTDNSLWVCMDRPLWRYGRESVSSYTWSSYNWSLYSYIRSYRVALAPGGNLWVMDQGNGMAYFDGSSFTAHDPPIHDIRAAVVGKNSILWIGSGSQGLYHYAGSAWYVYNTDNSGLPNNRVEAIASDEQGHLWIGTYGGLVHFDGTQWTIYNTENSGLLCNYITGIAFDSKNNVWVSTFGGGLSAFNENGIK